MNYLKQKNLYWQKHNGKNSLRGNECALYFYLLEQCDTPDGWVEEVEVRNSVLMDVLDISRRPYQSARDRLTSCGLIEFEGSNGSPFTKFCLFNAETKTFARTFAKKAQVQAKVGAKVEAKVGAPVHIDTKPKPKPKNTVAEAKPLALHPKMMKVYFDWFEKANGFAPKIDGQQGKALNTIIGYLSDLARRKFQKDEATATETDIEDYAQQVWNWLFDNWHKLDAFNQKLTRLSQINSNLQNLITQIKKENGGQQQHKTPQRGIGEDAINAFVDGGKT